MLLFRIILRSINFVVIVMCSKKKTTNLENTIYKKQGHIYTNETNFDKIALQRCTLEKNSATTHFYDI